MNQNKLYPCKQCGKEVKIRSKGLCTYCRNKQKGSVVKRYVLKQQTIKTRLKKKHNSELMKKFWEYHLEEIRKNPYCINCGVKLQCSVANLAHVLPKRKMGGNIEVADHLANCVYLCSSFDGQDCHNWYDSRQGSSKVYIFNAWTKIVEQYLKFRDEITTNTKYKEVFETWIEDNNLI